MLQARRVCLIPAAKKVACILAAMWPLRRTLVSIKAECHTRQGWAQNLLQSSLLPINGARTGRLVVESHREEEGRTRLSRFFCRGTAHPLCPAKARSCFASVNLPAPSVRSFQVAASHSMRPAWQACISSCLPKAGPWSHLTRTGFQGKDAEETKELRSCVCATPRDSARYFSRHSGQP